MRKLISALLALGTIVGVAGQAYAADRPSPNNTKQFYQQLDSERGN